MADRAPFLGISNHSVQRYDESSVLCTVRVDPEFLKKIDASVEDDAAAARIGRSFVAMMKISVEALEESEK